MRVKGFFINEKHYIKKWVYITFALFIIGIIFGSFYCATLSPDDDTVIDRYLFSYFNELNSGISKTDIFINSLMDSLRIFLVVFLSAFIRPGVVLIGASAAFFGFNTGFTQASFIKYLGRGGILATAVSLPALCIHFTAITILCATSFIFCINRHKEEKNKIYRYFSLAICCITIFCVASFFDAFITTTFMKLCHSIIVKI